MIDILTLELDLVLGGNGQSAQPPITTGVINPAGTQEIRQVHCQAAPVGEGSPFKTGDWICSENGNRMTRTPPR